MERSMSLHPSSMRLGPTARPLACNSMSTTCSCVFALPRMPRIMKQTDVGRTLCGDTTYWCFSSIFTESPTIVSNVEGRAMLTRTSGHVSLARFLPP